MAARVMAYISAGDGLARVSIYISLLTSSSAVSSWWFIELVGLFMDGCFPFSVLFLGGFFSFSFSLFLFLSLIYHKCEIHTH